MNRVNGTIIGCVLYLVVMVVSVAADLYKRAPDVLPGTLPEMKTTGYWTARMENPDEIILTREEIEQMNVAYEKKIRSSEPFAGVAEDRIPNISYWWPGHVLFVPEL